MQSSGESAPPASATTTTTNSGTSQQRRPPISSSKSICAEGGRPSGGERARPLMHSVSIVVELAQKGTCNSSSSSPPPPPATPSYCSYSCHSTSGGSTGTSASGVSSGSSGCEGSAALADSERRRLEKLVTGVGGGAGNRVVGGAGSPGKSVESDEENEKSDEKSEDEDEEEDCCLSSSLARRVVLVDEADKIFMRNRAQSADPHCAPAYLADLAARSGTPVGGSGAVRSPPPAPIHSADLSSQSIMQQSRLSRRSRHSVANISPTAIGSTGNWRASATAGPAARGVAGSPLAAGGSSELAERGELRQLSMRRNTHHQVNFERESPSRRQPSASFSFQHQPLVMRSSSSGNQQQQQSQTTDTLNCRQFNKQQLQDKPTQDNHHQQQQQQQQHQRLASSSSSTSRLPPIQHRRQSLQINLLGSLVRDSSRSLTEEELRGEREFNEQLRSAARSPDFFKHQHQHQVISANLHHQQLKRHNSQHQPARCQSTSGCWPALARDSLQPSSGASPTSTSKQAATRQHLQLQTISPNSAAGRRRRVSFGSIDPIVLTSTRSPDPQVAASPSSSALSLQQAASKRQRASICSSLLSSQQQLGILRKLAAPYQQQQQQQPQLASRMAERESEIAKATGLGSEEPTQNSCPRRSRLASVGEPSALAAAATGARTQDFQTSTNSTSELATSAGEPTSVGRRHQSKSISSATGAAPVANDDSRVRSIMANAKLRQEEFARLLEEHEQIVNEINKFETKISNGAAAAAKQQQQQQQQQQSGQL